MFCIFKKKKIIANPMELAGMALLELKESGKDKYFGVRNVETFVTFHASPRYGFNPEFDKTLLYKHILDSANGSVLDVGACSGHVSLLLQENKYEVYANDISLACCQFMERIGIKNIINKDVLEISDNKFDTILCLGSTLGVAGEAENLDCLLSHLCSILNPGGQILIEDGYLTDNKGYHQWKAKFLYRHYETNEFTWTNYSQDYITCKLQNLGARVETLIAGKTNGNYLVRAKL